MSTSIVENSTTLSHPIWVKLAVYEIGPSDAALTFIDRLARENGWTKAQAAGVMEEYRRFCFLAATAGHTATPSDAVDQAWHLHLTYSRDYWHRFCPEVLGRPLHHEPTAGGSDQAAIFFECYAQTLKSYEGAFGHCAPADLWPNAARRFLDDPKARRFHPREGFLVAWRQAAILLVAIAAFLAILLW